MDPKILLKGSIRKGLILFAVPLFFSNLFQTLYNTLDTVLIGYYLGDGSLAAIGAVASIFELIVGFCTGFGQGLGIIVAQAFGAGDEKMLRHCTGLSVLLSLVLSVIVSIAALWGMESLLKLLQTPSEILPEALSYILVISAGLIVTMFYNLCAGLLRAVGDAITPLVVLFISALINIGLDVLFIVVFEMGVAGTAYATVIAQLISLIVCLVWIYLKVPSLKIGRKDFTWDGSLAKQLTSMGLSMAFMSSIVSIGSVILQAGINGLGTAIIAAHTAARKVIMIVMMPCASIMMSLATFAAQNKGAGQYGRLIQGICFCDRLGIYYSIACTIFFWFSARWFIQIITNTSDPVILDNGAMYLQTNAPFIFVLAVVLNVRSSLQSMGIKMVPVLSSVVECVGKIIFTFLIIPFAGYLGVCMTEPIIWCFMAVYLAVHYKKCHLLLEEHIHPAIWYARLKEQE